MLLFNDVIYMMAPALKGGERLDDDGAVVYSNGYPVYEAKLMQSQGQVEYEFGTAGNGSPMAIYSRWIYDYGNHSVWCRRIASEDIRGAAGTLYSADNFPTLKISSLSQDVYGNGIRVDVDESTNDEAFVQTQTAFFDAENLVLSTARAYNATDRLIFSGKFTDTGFPIRVAFFGNSNITSYQLFDMLPLQPNRRFRASVGDIDFNYVGDNVASSTLGSREFSYNTTTRTVYFGSDISASWQKKSPFSLVVEVGNAIGNVEYLFSLATGQTSIELNFGSNSITFDTLYLNGYGKNNEIKYDKFVRIFSINRQPNEKLYFYITDGTVTDTKKVVVETNTAKREIYDNIKTPKELANKIASKGGSRLIDISYSSSLEDMLLFNISRTELQKIGFKISIYRSGYAESYDDLANATDAAELITDMSIFVRADVIADNGNLVVAPIIGAALTGGNSGINAKTLDYIDALAEAETKNGITLVIAPGIADAAFHAQLKDHCEKMDAVGKRRIAIVGGDLDETMVEKVARTEVINSKRVIMVGDGLVLISPVTKVRTVYPPSVVVAAVAGKIVSGTYYTSLTHQYMPNAYGTEHVYDKAQLEVLHEARLFLFENYSGVRIADAITTSTYNAYEDVHMVRIFDAVSAAVTVGMRRAMGNSNMPATWAMVNQIIRTFLENLQNLHAIESFKFLNTTMSQDLVDRRFVFRVGVVPVFPIKYVEGFVDIIPPMIL